MRPSRIGKSALGETPPIAWFGGYVGGGALRGSGYREVEMRDGPVRTTIGLDNTSRNPFTRPTGRPTHMRKARLPRGFRTSAILDHQRRVADPVARHRPGRDTRMGRVVRFGRAHQRAGPRQ